MTNRQKVMAETERIVTPVVAAMGVELVDIEFCGERGAPSLCLYLDRRGGITLDELRSISAELENILEIHDVIQGRYKLEVSSPGIDRPLKKIEDYLRKRGSRVSLKLFKPLPGGGKVLKGTLQAVVGEDIVISSDTSGELTIPYDNIAAAKPDIDWQRLMKQDSQKTRKESQARRAQ